MASHFPLTITEIIKLQQPKYSPMNQETMWNVCRTAAAVAVAKSHMQCAPRSRGRANTTPFSLNNRSHLCSTKGMITLCWPVTRRLIL